MSKSKRKAPLAVYCTISIQKDINFVQKVSCMTHEIPVYLAKYGNASVSLVLEQPDQLRYPPVPIYKPAEEYDKLEAKHGGNERGSWVEQVYQNRLVGSLKSQIGIEAVEFFEHANEEFEYDEVENEEDGEREVAAPKVAATKSTKLDVLLGDEPLGQPSKKAVGDWLKERDIDFDKAMSADELRAFVSSAIPQWLKAADPTLEVPNSGLNGLMTLYENVTSSKAG
jgi:hypothetical protein